MGGSRNNLTAIDSSPTLPSDPLSADELARINAYWRAANYLSVGQKTSGGGAIQAVEQLIALAYQSNSLPIPCHP